MTMDNGLHEASASSANLGPSASPSRAPSSESSVQRWYARRQLGEVDEGQGETTVDQATPADMVASTPAVANVLVGAK